MIKKLKAKSNVDYYSARTIMLNRMIRGYFGLDVDYENKIAGFSWKR